MTAAEAQEWEEARARTEIAASVAEDAAVDAAEADDDGDTDAAADAADRAAAALEEAIAAAEEALGEPVVADAAAPRPRSDAESEELAALYSACAEEIRRTVCAVDDGAEDEAAVRAAVVAARALLLGVAS